MKPKRLRLLTDVSGSMYRFNGYDQRLQRVLETTLLVMESLDGKKEKVIVSCGLRLSDFASAIFF